MAKILLLGDTHGQFWDIERVQLEAIKKFPSLDCAIQVGDFGFYPLCFDKWIKWGDAYRDKNYKLPLKTIVIDGNHEDHEWLKSQNIKEMEEKYNIFFKQRGTEETIDGASIGFFGGALNVDRPQEGSIDKRTTNYALRIEVEEGLKVFNSCQKIDLMVTHSCPHSIGVGMAGHPMFIESVEKFCHRKGHSTGKMEDCGEGSLRRLWHGLVNKPANWIYGHFHQLHFKSIDSTDFYCIGSTDFSDGRHYVNPFIYDTKMKSIEYFNDIQLLNHSGFHKTRLL